jgi:hypothetical protein
MMGVCKKIGKASKTGYPVVGKPDALPLVITGKFMRRTYLHVKVAKCRLERL